VPSPVLIRSQAGVKRDGTRFDSDFYSDAQWTRFQRGLPRKMGGWRTLTNTHAGAPRALDIFSRTGFSYVHVGHSSGLDVFTINPSGFASVPLSRTPSIFTTSASNAWDFGRVFDPFTNNKGMIIAAVSPHLTDISDATEGPVFWGDAAATTALTPMALPVTNTAFTAASLAGTTAIGSPIVTGISSTATITKNMRVTGTGIPAGTRVLSVDSGTRITLTANATAIGSPTLAYEVGGVSGGVLVLAPYVLCFGSNGLVLNSTAGDPNDFWGSGSNAAYVTDQKIIKGLIARGGPGYSPSGLLWSLDSLIRVYFSGGVTTFSFDTISNDITVLSPQSIIELDGAYYWAGTDSFYVYNGAVRELPNNLSLNWFYDNLNYAERGKVFAFRNRRWGEIWWCYPRGSATECTHAVIFNYREGTWYDTVLPGQGRSCAAPAQIYQYPLMGSPEATGGVYRVIQHEFGVDDIDGATSRAVEAHFETSDFSLLNAEKPSNSALDCSYIEPDFVQSGDMMISIEGRTNARATELAGDPVTFPATAGTPDEEVVRFKETHRQMRFRFSSNVVGGDFQMGKVFAQTTPSDKRNTT
jgi:hypothetical protein